MWGSFFSQWLHKHVGRCLPLLIPLGGVWDLVVQVKVMGDGSPAPGHGSQEEVGSEVAILFIGMSMILGVVCRQIFRGTKVPYTVALLVLGICLGAAEYGTSRGLGTLGASIRLWSTIDPKLILFVFLPALLFESSFAMEVHQVKRCIMQMLLLAGPGVLISTVCLGLVNHYLFPYGWDWSTSLLLGGLLSATDPVAVVALLKDLGTSKKLRTIVEGESLINDGAAIVVFQLFFHMVLGEQFNSGQIIEFFSRVAFGAVALGLGVGLVSVFWIGRVFNDTIVEITLTLTASYMAFFIAEDEANVSGVLTVITVGIFFAAFARTAFTGESQQSMHHFWEMVSYIANTLIFILSGTVIAESILRSGDKIEGRDWGYLVLLYVFLQLSRAVVVMVLYPGLNYFGYGLDWKEALILIWSGLRGAVALSLSLSVAQIGPSESGGYAFITKKTEARFVFFTGGVVFLTLIVNGSTTQFLLQLLRMNHTCETKALVLGYVRHEMYSKALESFGELGEDEDLGPAEWSTVCKYVNCLGQLGERGPPVHPHEATASEQCQLRMAFQDTRLRFLNGVQAAYWGMLEEGRISQTAAILLMQSVDEALDLVARHEPLLDWAGLQPHVRLPHYLKWSSSLLPKKLMTFLIVERLELGCYISAAFLRAHRQARQQLRAFIGESGVAESVIRESEAEEMGPKLFLEDVRLSFPQVMRVIKTKQVTHAILIHLNSYVKSLQEAGLLEDKETNHLHNILQVDLKKLQRNPPIVQMPVAGELLNSQPFFGALPAEVQKNLLNAARESMLFRENLLYEEDSKADGIWLISNGVVKWSGKRSMGRHLLHPTFSHGSTLGLYEVLTGKPRLCTVKADSVAHCFFIESGKILASLYSEPDLEDFLWQESALAVAKIILPQQFENLTMQELRALMEGCSMNTYIRGEVLELEYGFIGILLEGFLKQEGKLEIIGAPAGLLIPSVEPMPTNKGSRSSIISNQSVYYQAEARSRVLFVDLQSLHSNTSHHQSLSMLLPRQLSREHSGLLRYNSRRRSSHMRMGDNIFKTAVQFVGGPSTYSAKAMELSLFGSKIEGLNKSWSSHYIESIVGIRQPHSLSYPNVSKGALTNQFEPMHGAQQPQTVVPTRKAKSHGNLIFNPLPLKNLQLEVGHGSGYSSNESDAEDEHIVKIESPSRLFHFSNKLL